MYDRRLRCRGFDPATLGHWNHVAQALDAAMTRKRLRRRPLSARLLLGPDSPVPRPVKHLGRYLSDHGLDWDGLDPFLALRAELFEIDSRFGQLGGQGIFDALDRCGVLSHHVEGVDNFAHAREHPPAEGRARVRGECVRKIADRGSPAVCCWSRIFDHRERRVLDLSDPLENSEHWEPLPEEAGPEADALARAVAAFERSRASARTPEGLHIGQRVVLADPADSGGPSDLHPGAQRLIGQSGVIVRVHRAAGTGETIAHVRTAEGTRHWWSHALRPAEPEAQAAAASQDGGTPC
ncbi:MAG: proteasome accessory factor PafA2 family protein [Planctomycetota bacterium]